MEIFSNFQYNSPFYWILKQIILTLQITVASSYFIDTALKKYQILKKLFSDAKAENGLSFEDRSSCNRINSWVFNNIISYFFLCLQV